MLMMKPKKIGFVHILILIQHTVCWHVHMIWQSVDQEMNCSCMMKEMIVLYIFRNWRKERLVFIIFRVDAVHQQFKSKMRVNFTSSTVNGNSTKLTTLPLEPARLLIQKIFLQVHQLEISQWEQQYLIGLKQVIQCKYQFMENISQAGNLGAIQLMVWRRNQNLEDDIWRLTVHAFWEIWWYQLFQKIKVAHNVFLRLNQKHFGQLNCKMLLALLELLL